MTQETAFLKALAAVATFSVRPDGSLLFHTPEGQSIGTRPPAPPAAK